MIAGRGAAEDPVGKMLVVYASYAVAGRYVPSGIVQSFGEVMCPGGEHGANREVLLPVFAEHDRSQHAERHALLLLTCRLASCSMGSMRGFVLSRDLSGFARVYAGHAPCVSCLIVFCQFQKTAQLAMRHQ